jgi:hypothetical protein
MTEFGLRLEAVGKRYGLRQPWVVRPASAALHGNGATVQAAAWPSGLPLAVAAVLAAAAWVASCWLAGRRGETS